MKPRYPSIEYDATYAGLYHDITLGLAILIIPANLLLLYLLIRVRLYAVAISYQLIGLLALSDLLHGVLMLIARLCESLISNLIIVETDWFCQIFGTISHGLVCTSAYLLGLLAFERYWIVCKEHIVSSTCLWLIFAALELALIIPLTMVSIGKNLGADPIYGYCLPYGSIWANITSGLLIGSFILPLGSLIFCYIAISKNIFMCLTDPSQRKTVAFKSTLFITIYSLCYLPKFISSIWWRFGSVESIPRIIDVIGPLGVVFPHLLNPILVFAIHSQFKREAKQLFTSSRQSIKSIV